MKWHGYFYRKRDEPGRYMNRICVTANEITACGQLAVNAVVSSAITISTRICERVYS